jgi:hypothetical protein
LRQILHHSTSAAYFSDTLLLLRCIMPKQGCNAQYVFGKVHQADRIATLQFINANNAQGRAVAKCGGASSAGSWTGSGRLTSITGPQARPSASSRMSLVSAMQATSASAETMKHLQGQTPLSFVSLCLLQPCNFAFICVP